MPAKEDRTRTFAVSIAAAVMAVLSYFVTNSAINSQEDKVDNVREKQRRVEHRQDRQDRQLDRLDERVHRLQVLTNDLEDIRDDLTAAIEKALKEGR